MTSERDARRAGQTVANARAGAGRICLSYCVPSVVVVSVVLLSLAGCGSDRVPVTGHVTFNGESIAVGSISFEPLDRQGPTTGGKIVAGKYQLTGDAAPLPGKKLVRVFAARKTGRKIPAGPPSPPGTMVEEIERYIPKIYNDESTLTCEVSRNGSGAIDFALESK